MKLVVLDTNCSWIRSLTHSLPKTCHRTECRVYSPQWLPNGLSDFRRVIVRRKLSASADETYIVVPGWNRFPKTSMLITTLRLLPRILSTREPAFLFTFPFYSGVAAQIRKLRPSAKIVYHAHDPFEFYSYPSGYIRQHEDRIVPLCDHVFTIAEPLADDFRKRYPRASVSRLGNATSSTFLTHHAPDTTKELSDVRERGRIIGCIGQINSSYDWPLLESLASAAPDLHFVFIGNLFEEGETTQRIRHFFEQPNVHWRGPVAHERLPDYLGAFDVCLNPLKPNPHNDRRDTLRLYDYLTTSKPIVSTDISSAHVHAPFIRIGRTQDDFLKLMRDSDPSPEELAKRRTYIMKNTWEVRAEELLEVFA